MARIPVSDLPTVSSQGQSYRPEPVDRSLEREFRNMGAAATQILGAIHEKQEKTRLNKVETDYSTQNADFELRMANATTRGDKAELDKIQLEQSNLDKTYEASAQTQAEKDWIRRNQKNNKIKYVKNSINVDTIATDQTNKMNNLTNFQTVKNLGAVGKLDAAQYEKSLKIVTSDTNSKYDIQKNRIAMQNAGLSGLETMVKSGGVTESSKLLMKSLKSPDKNFNARLESVATSAAQSYDNKVYTESISLPETIAKRLADPDTRDQARLENLDAISKIQNTNTSPKFTETVKQGVLDKLMASAQASYITGDSRFNQIMLGTGYSELDKNGYIDAQAKAVSNGNPKIESLVKQDLTNRYIQISSNKAIANESNNAELNRASKEGLPSVLKEQIQQQQSQEIDFMSVQTVSPTYAKKVKAIIKQSNTPDAWKINTQQYLNSPTWYKAGTDLISQGAFSGSEILAKFSDDEEMLDNLAMYNTNYKANLSQLTEGSQNSLRKESVEYVKDEFGATNTYSPAYAIYKSLEDSIIKGDVYGELNNSKSTTRESIRDNFISAGAGESKVILKKSSGVTNNDLSELLSNPVDVLTQMGVSDKTKVIDLENIMNSLKPRDMGRSPAIGGTESWAKAGFQSDAEYKIAQKALSHFRDFKKRGRKEDYKKSMEYYVNAFGVQISNDIKNPNNVSFYTSGNKPRQILFGNSAISEDPKNLVKYYKNFNERAARNTSTSPYNLLR